MNPMTTARELEAYGFWYTLWSLRNDGQSWTYSLWLLWIARNYLRHRANLIF